jgi:hypothetical protein
MLNQNNAERLCKILGMLGSDHAGERAAAGLAAHRLLSEHRLTWDQVIVAPAIVPALSPVQSWHRRETDWQRMARFCWARRDRLSLRDQDFVRSMLTWRGQPSERQQDWLAGIYARFVRHEAAG